METQAQRKNFVELCSPLWNRSGRLVLLYGVADLITTTYLFHIGDLLGVFRTFSSPVLESLIYNHTYTL
ncbi:hypothetical protein SAMN05216175_102251 [Neptunomonas qingdaonensis]|uniref:Uncharacterized protein n=1 Tax=Neptunomonas qingdaonensis TaxID=1045558 RepID=A0A1I2N2C9_9GAMM|nr:hypothetical protein SAMN05216175_102251 [Neptunomonas qingdaonensis]